MHRTSGTGSFPKKLKYSPFRSSKGMRNDLSVDLLDKTYTIKQFGDDTDSK